MSGRHRLYKHGWRDVAFVGGAGLAAALAGMGISALVTPGVPLPAFDQASTAATYTPPSLLPEITPTPTVEPTATPKPTTATRPTPTPRPRLTAVPLRPAGACSSTGFGGVKAWVARVGHHVQGMFGITTVYGVSGGSVTGSDHPLGLALDFMVYGDRALGDRLAAYVLAHRLQLGVSYVIWYQRINLGAGWEPMADRGGVTANHMDHVHVSFLPTDVLGTTTLTC